MHIVDRKVYSIVVRRARRYASLLLLAVAFAACRKSVNPKQVFSDPAAVQVAEAAASTDTTRLDTLIKSGANKDAIGIQGVSLLQWAMLSQDKRAFEALLAAGADPTHAHYAAKAKDGWYLDVLLAHKTDLNLPNTHAALHQSA